MPGHTGQYSYIHGHTPLIAAPDTPIAAYKIAAASDHAQHTLSLRFAPSHFSMQCQININAASHSLHPAAILRRLQFCGYSISPEHNVY